VESSNSVRRPKSKETKSKNRVLKNTNDKSSSVHVRKMSSSGSIDSNKHETLNLTVCQSNASVLKTKTVNAVNDGLNIICVSCGKDVFMISHEKCFARYALFRDSRVKRALFTTPVATKSKNLETTSVVAKSRLSVVKTLTITNKVSSALSLSLDFSQSRTLSNYLQQAKSGRNGLKTNNVLIGHPRAKLLNHYLNKMTTLEENIIVAGVENRPPMLEKSMYDSWASRIHIFIKGKKLGRMMLDSINNGLLVYPTVEENG
ncbi:hypothetical protein Tco_1454890, partial [Tanacetum coccineum]